MKRNKILAKSTMAMFTKPTNKMEKKTDEDANVNGNTNAKPVLPALPASSEDKMASSENFSAKSIENFNTISISAGIKSREAKPALPVLSAPPASL
jgi:hypothetical protein